MEKKQNSVEWLAQAIYNKIEMRGDGKVFQGILDEANAIHNNEIIEAYREGRSDQQSSKGFYHRTAAQYYNEKFGGNNE